MRRRTWNPNGSTGPEIPPEPPKPPESLRTQLAKRQAEVEAQLANSLLPGAEVVLSQNAQAIDWLTRQNERIRAAIDDENEALFDQALGSLVRGTERANQIVAERYRKETPVEKWELRYVKWMRIQYIRFGSPWGDFVVIPHPPVYRPSWPVWYTVDDLIALVDYPEMVTSVLAAFHCLPQRQGAELPQPKFGEQMTVVDPCLPDPTKRIRSRLGKRPRW